MPMRITYIHQHFRHPSEGGGGRPYEFGCRLVTAGHEVTVIAGGPSDTEFSLDGMTVIQVAAPYNNRMGLWERLRSFVKFMAKSSIAAIRTPSDLVFASSTPLTVAVPGIAGAVRHRAPFVFEVRDLWPTLPISLGLLPSYLHGPARFLERAAYARASEVIALSPGMEEGVLRVSPKASTHVVPNCSDLHLVSPLPREKLRRSSGIPNDQTLMVYIGSLGFVYDAEWLSRLAILGNELGIRVLIAGDGAHRERIAERLLCQGLDPEQVLLGPVSRRTAFDLLAMSDAAVSSVIDNRELMHASINKVFDALAAGTPIAFNHGGWLSELVVEEGAGWLLPRDLTVDSLRNLLEDLKSHDGSSGRRRRARALAESKFDRELLFQEFHAVLQRARRTKSGAARLS